MILTHYQQIYFLLLFNTIFFVSCRTNEGEAPQIDQSTISLINETEPGHPLTLQGFVVDSVTKQPISQAQVYLYHADAKGQYLPTNPNDESTAKLSGEVMTEQEGIFTVHTIVPREYDQPGNRHIHLHYVRAEGYKETGGVILFENDVNDEIRQWANETGFGKIIELTERNGVMYGDITIELVPNHSPLDKNYEG